MNRQATIQYFDANKHYPDLIVVIKKHPENVVFESELDFDHDPLAKLLKTYRLDKSRKYYDVYILK